MPRQSIVIGTAGHIDHGKTALVKLLTGIDTDRLKEEKERGISIDLGFAHLTLPSGVKAGIVDVPGHERFVRNMLAGACGIDLVLFVVAADEGVMPQTREHLNIVDVLRVRGGVIALTKTDLVENDWVEMVRSDVRAAVEGSVLEDVPIVPVSSVTGKGKEEILGALDEAAARISGKETGETTRLPIDRVFTVEGFGTVVTGTLWNGRIKVGDNLEILPSGKKVRVRNVQVFGQDTPEVLRGHRVALAIHGTPREELKRGDWLATPGVLNASSMVDVKFELLRDASKSLRSKSRIRFHLGASEVIGRIYFLDREELSRGDHAFAQLRLESPVVAVQGDRFVLRSYSPQMTIGGGSVLVPRASKHRRKDGDAVGTLELIERGSPLERVEHAVRVRGVNGAQISEIAREVGVEESEAETLVETLAGQGRVHRTGSLAIHEEHLRAIKDNLVLCLIDYQREHRLRWGMTKGELRNRFGSVSPEVFSVAITSLAKDKRLFSRQDRYRLDSPEMVLSPEESNLKDRIEQRLLSAGVSVPVLKELATEGNATMVADVMQILAEDGRVVKVSAELFFHSRTIDEVEKQLRRLLSSKEQIQVAEFKDAVKASRKYAVPLLEYFDRIGVTRRQGDTRVLAKKS